MTRYLLDATVLIDCSKGREPANSYVLTLIEAGAVLGACGVTIAELYSGLDPAVPQPKLDRFVEDLTFWDISKEAAVQAGRYRYQYARKGTAIHTPDAIIAAVAKEVRATVVTDNTKDFPMPDVSVVAPHAEREEAAA